MVVLNAPWYRVDVSHGLRFWDASWVGVNCSDPDDLIPTVEQALDELPGDVARREHALDVVYSHRTAGATRAANAILDWSQAA